MFDEITKAEHYNSHPSGIECRQIIRHMNFNLGSAIKYIWRNGLKPNSSSIKDLKKAINYIEDEIKRIEESSLEEPIKEEYLNEPFEPKRKY